MTHPPAALRATADIKRTGAALTLGGNDRGELYAMSCFERVKPLTASSGRQPTGYFAK